MARFCQFFSPILTYNLDFAKLSNHSTYLINWLIPGLSSILLAVQELRNPRTLCTSNIRTVQNPFNLKKFPNAKMQPSYITFYLVFMKSNEQWAQIISHGIIE